MTTIKELLEKFNVNLNLEKHIMEHDITQDIGHELESFEKYSSETRDGQKIHVFRGSIGTDQEKDYFEYIINPEDKEEGGGVSLTFLGYSGDKTEVADSFHQLVFNGDSMIIGYQ